MSKNYCGFLDKNCEHRSNTTGLCYFAAPCAFKTELNMTPKERMFLSHVLSINNDNKKILQQNAEILATLSDLKSNDNKDSKLSFTQENKVNVTGEKDVLEPLPEITTTTKCMGCPEHCVLSVDSDLMDLYEGTYTYVPAINKNRIYSYVDKMGVTHKTRFDDYDTCYENLLKIITVCDRYQKGR